MLHTRLLAGAWADWRAAHPAADHAARVARAAEFAAQRASDVLPGRLPGVAASLSIADWCQSVGLRVSAGTLDRYVVRLARGGDNADRRGRPQRPRGAWVQGEYPAGVTPDAWDLFCSLYQSRNRLPLSACHRFVAGEARRQDWRWLSEPALRALVCREFPAPALVLTRAGPRAFEAQCVPKIERDIEDILPGEWWCLDGRTLDGFIRVPDQRREWRRMRPTLMGVLDLRSRSLCLDVRATEQADGILSGIKQALRAWGAPTDVIADNGQGYKAALGHRRGTQRQRALLTDPRIAAVFAQLGGVTLHNSIEYHAWAKPIESIWKKVKTGFDQWLWHYWGGSPAERPEGRDQQIVARLDELPTEDELRELLGVFLREYHATEQSGAGTRGLPPIVVMEQYRGTIRRVDAAVIDVVCARRFGPVKVGSHGVRWRGINYGQTDDAVLLLQGREVSLIVDPERLDQVTLADEAGRPLAIATNRRLRGATQDDLRESMRTKARFRRAVKQYAPAQNYLRETPTAQVLETKAQHAEARLADLRSSGAGGVGVPPAGEPLVTLVRPDLAAGPVSNRSRVAPTNGPREPSASDLRRSGIAKLAQRAREEELLERTRVSAPSRGARFAAMNYEIEEAAG